MDETVRDKRAAMRRAVSRTLLVFGATIAGTAAAWAFSSATAAADERVAPAPAPVQAPASFPGAPAAPAEAPDLDRLPEKFAPPADAPKLTPESLADAGERLADAAEKFADRLDPGRIDPAKPVPGVPAMPGTGEQEQPRLPAPVDSPQWTPQAFPVPTASTLGLPASVQARPADAPSVHFGQYDDGGTPRRGPPSLDAPVVPAPVLPGEPTPSPLDKPIPAGNGGTAQTVDHTPVATQSIVDGLATPARHGTAPVVGGPAPADRGAQPGVTPD
ncbi:hypothetical protein EV193_105221 [Herbihabitans rhizosphaerae]|uniref:Uncharacterized protein n=1 Tax=Herbihabitans rhizosphaerae TaxID=1872711 RepID=A0A4V2ESI2_9PSEU|nr:hypothetical protein [Herbihabitans rhizosphaerae]RZS37663.1 hypothetical protein EV193_105221 [Herbihabitans rhizosphaerae]